MKCPNCGEELIEGAKFCTSCGHKVEIPREEKEEKFQEDDITPMPSAETIRAFQSKEKTISEKLKELAYDQWLKLELYGKIVTIEVILFTLLFIVALLTRKIPAICIVVFQFALVIAASLYHLGLIETDKKKNWIKWLMLCIAASLTFLNIMSYSWEKKKQYQAQNSSSYENEKQHSNSSAEQTEEVTSAEEVTSEVAQQTEQTSSQDDRPNKNGFNSATNEIYSMGKYTIEIPDYWGSENKITDGIQRYAETGNKVAMLQITASEDTDENYSVTFESLERDNEYMIQALESTVFQKITDYEVLDTGIVKGMLYKGNLNETDTFFKDYDLTGYGEYFVFPSESDRKWCYIMIGQTDNTDYSYLDDYMQMLSSIKEIDNKREQSTPTEVTSENSETTTSQEPSTSYTDKSKEENLTMDNCPELAAMLANKADLDPSYAEFAKKHSGQKIEFDGRIDYCGNHGKYKTRYDYLVSAGDYDPDHQTGPAFKFNDVNYFDLNTDLETVKVGQNVHIIAVVESYDSNSGLFFLDPVSITGR